MAQHSGNGSRYKYNGQQRKATAGNPNIGNVERMVSLVGGALTLAGLAGLLRRSPLGVVPTLVGGYLVLRGATTHDVVYEALGVTTPADGATIPNNPLGRSIHVERSITVGKAPEEVYRFWRNFENLPGFMQHLESVTTLDEGRSHWAAKAPAGTTVEWDAEIVDDQPNQRIAWESLPGAAVENSGVVEFHPAPGDRGTELRVTFDYKPPAGALGAVVARLFGEEPLQQVQDDLRHFKQMLETGEVATVEGQSTCR